MMTNETQINLPTKKDYKRLLAQQRDGLLLNDDEIEQLATQDQQNQNYTSLDDLYSNFDNDLD